MKVDIFKIIHGDCREVLPTLDKASAIVTDPPYELGFMGKSWDSKGVSFQKETWQAVRNACKSGAMLLSFGGTRTFHRIACAIEDAGFEYRDTIMWCYGSGFPKSLDISKAIDKQSGTYVKGEILPSSRKTGASETGIATSFREKTAANPQSPEAQLWEGYGTALKPAYEPIIVAMNPIDGTFANNALKHGVAGLNIDGCRVGIEQRTYKGMSANKPDVGTFRDDNRIPKDIEVTVKGRFPANLIHDGSQIVMDLFPNTGQPCGSVKRTTHKDGMFGIGQPGTIYTEYDNGNNSAARFFYCAKASKSERDRGMDDIEPAQYSHDGRQKPIENPYQRNDSVARNNHPTVKPLALMEYLIKLVTMPEYNLIIDPFCGSGSTLVACIKLGIPCIGIDSDEHSCEIANKRCSNFRAQ